MVKNSTKRRSKNQPTSKKYTKYKIEGDKIIREKSCPRCGMGVFLMKAENRLYCGKCHYTLFEKKEVKKAEEKNIEEKKESEEKKV